jgi:hypothetical protein
MKAEKDKPLVPEMFPENAGTLLNELRAHQIELEMQIEKLRKAQEKIQASSSRYADLYDSAPVGYFVFSETGKILEVNLTGAQLLGLEKSQEWIIYLLYCRKVSIHFSGTFASPLKISEQGVLRASFDAEGWKNPFYLDGEHLPKGGRQFQNSVRCQRLHGSEEDRGGGSQT